MSNMNQFYSSIKSIQRGVTSCTDLSVTNVTISSVDLNKSFISSSCTSGRVKASGAPTAAISYTAAPTLTSATNLQLPASAINDQGTLAIVNWEVIEYY